jgi:diaminopimelate epimerase
VSAPGATRFFKLSGAGNDFVALAAPATPPRAEQIAAWCRRGLSLGADGLFVLRRAGVASGIARVEMEHFNADGGRAELCFNGARCAARLAFHLGWAEGAVEVATASGVFRAELAAPGVVRIEAPVPEHEPEAVRLPLEAREAGGLAEPVEAWRLEVGVPHLVVVSERAVGDLDLPRLGPPLRRHPQLGPAGANVDFVAFPEPSRLELRTWERGVEGETLACGSGVVAAALVGIQLGRLRLPLEVRTAGGQPLRLEGTVEERRPTRWSLTGDARLVAEGTLGDEAIAPGRAPGWE